MSATRATNPRHVLVYAAPAPGGFVEPLAFVVGEVLPARPSRTMAIFHSRADAHEYALGYAAAHEAATGEEVPVLVMPSAELPR